MENNGKSPAEGQEAIGFAALSDVSADSIFEEFITPTGEKKEDNGSEEEEPEVKEIVVPGEKKDGDDGDDKGGDEKDGKGGDKGNGSEEEEEEEGNEIILPGEEPAAKKGDSQEEPNTESWTDLAKELGFEIKEDNFEEFKKSYDIFRETEKAELEKEYKVKGKEDLLVSFDPEAQFIIKALDAGLTMDQIQKPFAEIDKFLSLSDADLVAQDLRLQGWPEDKIEAKVLDLTETGKLELNAFEIRKILEDSKKEISLSREKELSDIKTQQEQKVKDTLNKEAEEIHKQLKTVQTFMESPIKDKHIDYVMNKWKNGEYHEAFKDPKKIADFLLYSEFGEQAVKNLANRKLQEGRSKIVKKLHNIPPLTTGNAGSSTKANNNESPVGNFGILEGLTEDQV